MTRAKGGLRYPCKVCGKSVRHEPGLGDHVLDEGTTLYCPECGGSTIAHFEKGEKSIHEVFQVDDRVRYKENYRSSGSVGGWKACYFEGKVVKVNRRNLQIVRRLSNPYGTAAIPYGFEAKIRVIPIERCEKLEKKAPQQTEAQNG